MHGAPGESELSLAFLAPQLVKAAVEGRLPRGINIQRLRDPDPNGAKQFQDLGLNPNCMMDDIYNPIA
jgi:hypothetical protein